MLDHNVIPDRRLKSVSERMRKKHSKLLAKALKDRSTIAALALQNRYTKEQIQYGLEFYNMFLDLEDNALSLYSKTQLL